eukprot:6876890-Pyramimonas_sp.AAC.1
MRALFAVISISTGLFLWNVERRKLETLNSLASSEFWPALAHCRPSHDQVLTLYTGTQVFSPLTCSPDIVMYRGSEQNPLLVRSNHQIVHRQLYRPALLDRVLGQMYTAVRFFLVVVTLGGFHVTGLPEVGGELPSIKVFEGTPDNAIDIKEVFGTKRGILFGVPGAFTPGCSKTHLPSYLAEYKHLKAAGALPHLFESLSIPTA